MCRVIRGCLRRQRHDVDVIRAAELTMALSGLGKTLCPSPRKPSKPRAGTGWLESEEELDVNILPDI